MGVDRPTFGRRHVEGIAGLPFSAFDGVVRHDDDRGLVYRDDDGSEFVFPRIGDGPLDALWDALHAAPFAVALWPQPTRGVVEAIRRGDGEVLATYRIASPSGS